jgi:hypothetical protein
LISLVSRQIISEGQITEHLAQLFLAPLNGVVGDVVLALPRAWAGPLALDRDRHDLRNRRATTGEELARGLSAYDAADAQRIAGHRSAEIEALLGWRGRDELIHRDDLVLL